MRINSQKPHRKKLSQFVAKLVTTGIVFAFVLTTIFPNPLSTAQAQTSTSTATSTSEITNIEQSFTEETRARLQERLDQINLEIKEQQEEINEIRSDEQTIENRLSQLQAQINSLNLQIEAVDVNLQRLDQEIYETQRNINRTQSRIEDHKEALSDSIQKVYETDNQTLITILLKNNTVSDFFNNVNNILLVQNNIRNSLDQVTNLRQELIQEKEDLNSEREEVEGLKLIRQQQQQQLSVARNEQQSILSATQEERIEQEEALQEKQKTASEIRSQIFQLVGGGRLTFETAYDLAKLAENATGIRAALIMAILQRETNTGNDEGEQFLGGCYYEGAMHPDRDIPVFMAITENLGIDPNSEVAKVSCPLSYGWGGAMGPSQFIPSTWAIYGGYEKVNGEWRYNRSEDYIREVSGSNGPSNPWNNADAFTATALYIQDLYTSRTCTNYADGLDHRYPRQELQEECASAQYYAGGNWRDYYSWYGIDVRERADEIQQDIEVIE